VHGFLETSAVPIFWTVNDTDCLGDSVIRRMADSIEMQLPPYAARRRITKRVLTQAGLPEDTNLVDQLALSAAPPAVIAKAVELAASRETSQGDVLGSVIAVAAAMGIRGAQQIGVAISPSQVIDPRLVNSDVDVVAMAEALKRSRARRISFCVAGPSGTGKSAWVRHLAGQLEFEVLTKRASDLLDRYVGSTEKNIMRMFEEACDLGAFLILDEADSLLRDRKSARYSWEVSLVNEMLNCLERHLLPFACTTNLVDTLDAASARPWCRHRCPICRSRGMVDASFLAHIVVAKFCDQLGSSGVCGAVNVSGKATR
jgi:transitional endoplasmic reticulum ATPase